jgi:hypothetical protein
MNTAPNTISTETLAVVQGIIREIKNEVSVLAQRRLALWDKGHLADAAMMAQSKECPDKHEISSPSAAVYWQYYETDAILEQLKNLEDIIKK